MIKKEYKRQLQDQFVSCYDSDFAEDTDETSGIITKFGGAFKTNLSFPTNKVNPLVRDKD
jgi:hypothetical protein